MKKQVSTLQMSLLNGLIAGLVIGFGVFFIMIGMGYFGESVLLYLSSILLFCAIGGLVGGVLGGMTTKRIWGARIGGGVVSLITILILMYLANTYL